MRLRRHSLRLPILALALATALLLTACTVWGNGIGKPAVPVPGGQADNGPSAMRAYGCISCHTIPGVRGANGKVGPPLTDWSQRGYIAGMLPNTPDNLIHWIKNPQSVVPGNDMPNLGVSDSDARDIAAYLYTLGN